MTVEAEVFTVGPATVMGTVLALVDAAVEGVANGNVVTVGTAIAEEACWSLDRDTFAAAAGSTSGSAGPTAPAANGAPESGNPIANTLATSLVQRTVACQYSLNDTQTLLI